MVSIGEEGRETCDKLRGVGKDSDPEMSEWGNPMGVKFHYRILNT